MAIHTHILSSSKELRPYATKLESTVNSVALLIKDIIPVEDIDVVFYDNPTGTIKEIGGIGGYTPVANVVFISLDPRHHDFNKSLDNELAYQLAHEFHHAVRFRTPIETENLFEAIISEGLADCFAMEVTKKVKPEPWTQILTEDQYKVYLNKAIAEWKNPVYDHGAWFFGSKQEIIPRWAGYSIGYRLVSEYLRNNPDTSAAKLVSSDASLFYSL